MPNSDTLAYLTLVVALVGGVPGMVEALKYRRSGPGFVFRTRIVDVTEIEGQISGVRMVFTGCLANSGGRALWPMSLGAILVIDGRTIVGQSQYIGAGTRLNSGPSGSAIVIEDPSSDDLLQLRREIPSGSVVNGHLQVFFQGVTEKQFRDAKEVRVEMRCIDVFGKHFVHKESLGNSEFTSESEIPWHVLGSGSRRVGMSLSESTDPQKSD